MSRRPFPNVDGVDRRALLFLYPHRPDPNGVPKPGRSFFSLPKGSDVPAKYPARLPIPNTHDFVVKYLLETGGEDQLSILTLVSRDWCHAVRTHRFHGLELLPAVNRAQVLDIFRPDTVMPYVRHLHIDGRIKYGQALPDGQADHRWLNEYTEFIAALRSRARIDYLSLVDLSWGDIHPSIRMSLRDLPHVRALSLDWIDWWNANQYLMVLNSYPELQYLKLSHMVFHALSYLPTQLTRTEPLLLTELDVGCSYTNILLEWLLGQRPVLAIEELTIHARDRYRDDARLARLVRKVSPWLKRLRYFDEIGEEICEGAVFASHSAMDVDDENQLAAQQIAAYFAAHADQDMDNDYQVAHNVAPTNRDRHMKPVLEKLLLPDDEGQNALEDGNDELYNPPFSSHTDHGFSLLAEQLTGRIHTPMLEAVEARIRWTAGDIHILTLKMLCLMTFENDKFETFDLDLEFPTVRAFESATWPVIDAILAHACRRLPVEAEEDEEEEEDSDSTLLLRLRVIVSGWEASPRGQRAGLRDMRRNLPRTVATGMLEFEFESLSFLPDVEMDTS